MTDTCREYLRGDKEEQLSPKSRGGAKFADKLAKVYLKDGTEQWILVHIEVQGDAEEEFSLRMFRYFYRIYDRHGKPIVSIALMTGTDRKTGDGQFLLQAYGSGVEEDERLWEEI